MADKNSKQPLNVPGAWYVDTTCTMCRTCLEEAPNLLKTNDDETPNSRKATPKPRLRSAGWKFVRLSQLGTTAKRTAKNAK
jgi:hypothetical protein